MVNHLIYLQTRDSDYDYEIKLQSTAIILSATIATADQLVTSVFKYSGSELVYLQLHIQNLL